MRKIVRGEPLTISVTFKDGVGNVVTPASAILYVAYSTNGRLRRGQVDMTASDSLFTGVWDSSVAESGAAYWSARSTSPACAYDGEFEIDANAANPGPNASDGMSGDGPSSEPL